LTDVLSHRDSLTFYHGGANANKTARLVAMWKELDCSGMRSSYGSVSELMRSFQRRASAATTGSALAAAIDEIAQHADPKDYSLMLKQLGIIERLSGRLS
jgi:hypothetical protein